MKSIKRRMLGIIISAVLIISLVQIPKMDVHAKAKLRSISLTIDTASINLNTDELELDVDSRINEEGNTRITGASGGISVDVENSGLAFRMPSGVMNYATSDKYRVQEARPYYYRICIDIDSSWEFYSDIVQKYRDSDMGILNLDDIATDKLYIKVNDTYTNHCYMELFSEDDENVIDYIYLYVPATVKKGSKPVEKIETKTISEVNLGYDPEYVDFKIGAKEGDIDTRINESSGCTTDGICMFYAGLCYYVYDEESGMGFWGIDEGLDKIASDKKYYVAFSIELDDQTYFKWASCVTKENEFVSLSATSAFKVVVNGRQAKADSYVEYNSGWNSICIYVPYSSEPPANKSELIDIKDATVTGVTDMKYTGEEVWPDYDLYMGSKKLTEGVDYNTKIENNINEGIATITFIGVGKYTGKISKNFRIGKDVAEDKGGKKDGKAYKSEWINGKWYDENGLQTYPGILSWKQNAIGWWVEDSAGWYPVNQWQKIDGIWYYFNASGYMASNEYYNGYWFNADGSWDERYFLTWKSNSTGWWVEDVSGWWPQSSWLKVDGYWYYFDASGYMVTNQYVEGWWIGADGVCY